MLRYTRACMTRWRGFRPTTDSAERQISQDWRSAETAPTADILLRRLALAKHKVGARSFWCDWHFQRVSHAVYSWNVLDVDDILFAQVSEVYHSRPLRGWIVIHRGEKKTLFCKWLSVSSVLPHSGHCGKSLSRKDAVCVQYSRKNNLFSSEDECAKRRKIVKSACDCP